jgi:hypothetical protein
VKDEIDVVWNAVTEALSRWRNTFPQPPAYFVSWPADFNASEKREARLYVRAYLDANEHLYASGIERVHLLEAVEALKGDFPIAKGNQDQAIMPMVKETCYDDGRLTKLHSLTGSYTGSIMSENEALEVTDEEMEDEQEHTHSAERRSKLQIRAR